MVNRERRILVVLALLKIALITSGAGASTTDSPDINILEERKNNASLVTTTKRPLPDRCQLKTESGPCKHYIHKWTFIKAEGKCKTFVYGGCLGNENRFNSQLECLHHCIGGPNCKFDIETVKNTKITNPLQFFDSFPIPISIYKK